MSHQANPSDGLPVDNLLIFGSKEMMGAMIRLLSSARGSNVLILVYDLGRKFQQSKSKGSGIKSFAVT